MFICTEFMPHFIYYLCLTGKLHYHIPDKYESGLEMESTFFDGTRLLVRLKWLNITARCLSIQEHMFSDPGKMLFAYKQTPHAHVVNC